MLLFKRIIIIFFIIILISLFVYAGLFCSHLWSHTCRLLSNNVIYMASAIFRVSRNILLSDVTIINCTFLLIRYFVIHSIFFPSNRAKPKSTIQAGIHYPLYYTTLFHARRELYTTWFYYLNMIAIGNGAILE